MVSLLIAVVVGVALALGAAVVTTSTLTGVTNGSPSKVSLYQYGNR
jgi:hypothetical protein